MPKRKPTGEPRTGMDQKTVEKAKALLAALEHISALLRNAAKYSDPQEMLKTIRATVRRDIGGSMPCRDPELLTGMALAVAVFKRIPEKIRLLFEDSDEARDRYASGILVQCEADFRRDIDLASAKLEVQLNSIDETERGQEERYVSDDMVNRVEKALRDNGANWFKSETALAKALGYSRQQISSSVSRLRGKVEKKGHKLRMKIKAFKKQK